MLLLLKQQNPQNVFGNTYFFQKKLFSTLGEKIKITFLSFFTSADSKVFSTFVHV